MTAVMASAACSKASSRVLPMPRMPISASCGKCSQCLLPMRSASVCITGLMEVAHDFGHRCLLDVRPVLVRIRDGETQPLTYIRTVQRINCHGNSRDGFGVPGRYGDDDFARRTV